MSLSLHFQTLLKTQCSKSLQIFSIPTSCFTVKPTVVRHCVKSFCSIRPQDSYFKKSLQSHPLLSSYGKPCHVRHFSKDNTKKSPISWKTVVITTGIGSLFTLAMFYFKQQKELKLAKERTRQLGKASLGGPWRLIDHNNKPKSNEDFFGQWVLLYFGFTHCPDICPDEIEKMIQAVDMLEKNPSVSNVQPLFITVDPERDTVKAIKSYVNEFSPKLLGLTGDKESIHQATRAYRVYYSSGPKDEDNDYIVDHTIIMYLINPKGDFVDYFGQNRTAEDVYNSIMLHMKKYEFMN
ncbi:protein SCO1 homolog, mitochondrial-like [Argonauta hians]